MKRLLFAVALLMLAGYALTGLTEVRPGERAVVRRFGRGLPEKPEPGLHVGLPWGMDRVDRVAGARGRRVPVGYEPVPGDGSEAPPGQLLTGDHNLVNVRVVLHYSIKEDEVEDYVVQADRVDELLARAAEASLAE